jgi:hypothetical protein
MLTYDDVCWCMLTYADVCWRMLTYADVCWRMLAYADVCWRMLSLQSAQPQSALHAAGGGGDRKQRRKKREKRGRSRAWRNPASPAGSWSRGRNNSKRSVLACSYLPPRRWYCYMSAFILYFCPHATLYSYTSVLKLLIICPHTTVLHTTMYLSSYSCICVLILLYMCPHTTIYLPSCCYILV